jgi:unsaturated rhamnogalacturonyl hydrolase
VRASGFSTPQPGGLGSKSADEETRVRLRRAADLLTRHPFRGWFYGDSVGFEGLLAASDLLSEQRWQGFAHGFLRGWASRLEGYQEMDNTAPGRALCQLVERTGDELLLEAGIALATWLRSRPTIGAGAWVSFAAAPLREPYGGAGLPPAEAALLQAAGPGVYLDCLHFDPPFLVHLGRLLGDEAMLEAGVEQALAYVAMLQDPDSGLFRHFWLERTGRAYALGWARGQGWALLGLLDVLEQLPAGHPAWSSVAAAARSLAGAMAALQRDDGSWWAVAQEPASGPEASTAAFMATAFARGVGLGVLPAEPFRSAGWRAWAATRACLDGTGVLTGVSAAVWSSTSLEHYFHVPRGFTVPWGQGPLLLAAGAWLASDRLDA